MVSPWRSTVIVRGEAQITEEVMQAASQVKVVARTGVGYNNVDVAGGDAVLHLGVQAMQGGQVGAGVGHRHGGGGETFQRQAQAEQIVQFVFRQGRDDGGGQVAPQDPAPALERRQAERLPRCAVALHRGRGGRRAVVIFVPCKSSLGRSARAGDDAPAGHRPHAAGEGRADASHKSQKHREADRARPALCIS